MFACTYVCVPEAHPKRSTVQQELQMVVSQRMGAGNQTRVSERAKSDFNLGAISPATHLSSHPTTTDLLEQLRYCYACLDKILSEV